ncbi:hypothetical protein MMC16_007240 [Acarospora aff. strigata]|nr:hypothetical protein [Acarospora aff. strigata]
MADSQTLNIPQLLAVLLIGFLIFRWFFSSRSPSPSNPNDPRPQDSRNNTGRRADPRHVEQIAQMFPQIGRREIQWDLQRNGGSPAATTERILSGRGLEVVSLPFLALFVSEEGGRVGTGGKGRRAKYPVLREPTYGSATSIWLDISTDTSHPSSLASTILPTPTTSTTFLPLLRLPIHPSELHTPRPHHALQPRLQAHKPLLLLLCSLPRRFLLLNNNKKYRHERRQSMVAEQKRKAGPPAATERRDDFDGETEIGGEGSVAEGWW